MIAHIDWTSWKNFTTKTTKQNKINQMEMELIYRIYINVSSSEHSTEVKMEINN